MIKKYFSILLFFILFFNNKSKAAFIIKGTTSIYYNNHKEINLYQNEVPYNVAVENANLNPYEHYSNDRHVHHKQNKSQLLAILLSCPFFGLCFYGIHRFYLGYVWQGLVQLLAFLLGYITLLTAISLAIATATAGTEIIAGIGAILIFGAFLWEIIDFFRICSGDLKPKYGDYGRTNRNR